MFGGFKKQRTKVVAEVLLRIESYILNITRATTAQLDHKAGKISDESKLPTALLQKAQSIAADDSGLGSKSVGLSMWGTLNLDGTAPVLLGSLEGLVAKALQFRGSSQGLTSEGKQLVEGHFSILQFLHQQLKTIKTETEPESSETLAKVSDALKDARNRLAAQVDKAKSMAEVGQ